MAEQAGARSPQSPMQAAPLSLKMGFQDDWLFSENKFLHETPSRYDGITYEEELQLRRLACEYIDKIRNSMPPSSAGAVTTSRSRSRSSRDSPGFIRLQVVLTAKVLLQRFYTQHSFKTHPWEDVALAALFLAAKVEDRPVKLVVIINKFFRVLDISHEDYVEKSKDEEYLELKSRVLKYERIILHTLSFNVGYSTTHQNTSLRTAVRRNAPETQWKTVESFAKTFLNDSFQTVACLLFKPDVVAGSMVYLALRMNGFTAAVEDGASQATESTSQDDSSTSNGAGARTDSWLLQFNATKDQVTYLSRLMLSMYDEKMKKVGKSSPQMVALMNSVEQELGPASLGRPADLPSTSTSPKATPDGEQGDFKRARMEEEAPP